MRYVAYGKIKPSILKALNEYVQRGRMPGGFLRAVLENDLSGAICRADADNLAALDEIVIFLNSEIPARAWGDPGNVKQWAGNDLWEYKSAEARRRVAAAY